VTSRGGTAAPTDLYEVLGVSVGASQSEILAAVKREAKKWHPDRNKAVAAEQRMRAVNTAKSVLRDPAKRAAYDRTLPPWLDTTRVNLGVLRAGATTHVASKVCICRRVDGVESLRFEPEYGDFWRIHSAKRQRVDSVVLEFEIAGDVPASASAGVRTATLAVVFNDVVLELVVGATILAAAPATAARGATSGPGPATTGPPAPSTRPVWPPSPVTSPARSAPATTAAGSSTTSSVHSPFRLWRTIGGAISGIVAVAILVQVLAGAGRDGSPTLSQTSASTDAIASPDAVAAAAAFSQAAASGNSSLLQDGRDIAEAGDANQERVIYAAFAADERTFLRAVAQIAFPQDLSQPLDQWVSAHQAMADTFAAAAQASTPEDYGTQILAQSQTAYDAGNAMRSALGLPPIAPGDRA
jgi:hypothetical protein